MSPHTVRAYDSDLSQFLDVTSAAIGSASATSSSPRRSTSTRDPCASSASCTSAGSRGRSAARKLAAVRTFVRYLRREELIDDDPAALVGDAEARESACRRTCPRTR